MPVPVVIILYTSLLSVALDEAIRGIPCQFATGSTTHAKSGEILGLRI